MSRDHGARTRTGGQWRWRWHLQLWLEHLVQPEHLLLPRFVEWRVDERPVLRRDVVLTLSVPHKAHPLRRHERHLVAGLADRRALATALAEALEPEDEAQDHVADLAAQLVEHAAYLVRRPHFVWPGAAQR